MNINKEFAKAMIEALERDYLGYLSSLDDNFLSDIHLANAISKSDMKLMSHISEEYKLEVIKRQLNK